MKPKSFSNFLKFVISTISLTSALSAQDGTWNVDADGSWDTDTNWLGSAIADGSGNTASFTNDISGTRTITLDSDRSIGGLIFSDNGASGSAWILSGGNTLTLAGTTPTISTLTNATISSIIAGSDGLTKTGAARLALSGANTYSGGTTLSGGTLQVSHASALGSGSVLVTDDSTLTVSIGDGFSNNIAINSGVNLSVNGGYNRILGVISGDGRVTGTGNIRVQGANTYTGGTTITDGFFSITSDASLGAVPGEFDADNIVLSGGGNLSSWIASGPVVLNANRGITLNAANTGSLDTNNNALTVSGVISGEGILRKLGNNTLILQAANTYTGGTRLSRGTLRIENSQALGNTTVTVDNSGTNTARLSPQVAFSNNIIINSGAFLGFSGAFVNTNGVISGPGRIETTGSAVLTADNTYSGGTVINDGYICIAKDSSLGLLPESFDADNLIFNGTGSLSTFGASAASNVVIHANRGITIGAGFTAAFDPVDTTTLSINGVISGQGGIRTVSAITGNLVLSALNTYTGKTVISQQNVVINSIKNVGDLTGSSLGNPQTAIDGTIDLGSAARANATLRYVGTGDTTDRVINLAALTGAASLEQAGTGVLEFTSDFTATGVGTKTLTLTGSSEGVGKISGAIVDNELGVNRTFIRKTGTGTWILSGENTYTGDTTVVAGTLGGSGSAASFVEVQPGGTLSPGDGIGNFTASEILFDGGELEMEINSATESADSVTVEGAIDLLDTALSLSDLSASEMAIDTKLILIDYTGGSLSGNFLDLEDGASVTVGKNIFEISYEDEERVTLTVTENVASVGYVDWADDYAGGQAPELDFDNDGVSNGVEFFLGTTTPGFTPNPQLDESNTISWTNGGNIDPSAYGTQFVVQTSTNLENWTDVPLANVTNTASALTYTVTGTGKQFVRLRVAPTLPPAN